MSEHVFVDPPTPGGAATPVATGVQPAPWRPWVTFVVIGVTTIVWVITVALGAHVMMPSPQKMIDLGGNTASLTLDGQPWRLVTSMFLHYGVLHIAMNMLGLWSGGALAERMYGRAGYLAVYVLTGLAGGVASVAMHANTVSAGASGAIFGVFGAIGAYLFAHRDRIDRVALQKQARGLVIFMAYNLLYGVSQKAVDMSAHVGGLAAGFVLGLALEWGRTDGSRVARIAIVTVLGLGAVTAGVLATPRPAPSALQATYAEFDRVELQAMTRFNELVRASQTDQLTSAAFADALEHEVLPPWRALATRFKALPAPDAKLQPLHHAIAGLLAARDAMWTQLLDDLHGKGDDFTRFNELQRSADEFAGKLSAEVDKLK